MIKVFQIAGISPAFRGSGASGEEHFKVMARDAAESPQVLTNPIPASETDMLALFRAAM